MGYEVTRFTHKIDEEFYCSICELVLKDPMLSPCGYLFCYECIKAWVEIGHSCPVERRPLKLGDMKPAPRAVRNFVNKFEIKCDFESKGCPAIVKLENLEDHVGRCEYYPNAKVICDNGYNIEMRRHEYATKNCFQNLADQVRLQHGKLNDEVTSLRRQQEDSDCKVMMLTDEVKRKSEAIETLNAELSRRGCEIERLNEDLNQIRRQIEQPQNFIVKQSDETSKLGNDRSKESKHLLIKQHEFRFLRGNLTISIGRCFGQSFKVEILSLEEYIWVGLAPMYTSGVSPTITTWYRSDGLLWIRGEWEAFETQWKVGDIIECGINVPSDVVNVGRNVYVYFTRNGELIREELVAKPIDGFIPTVCMERGSDIKYVRN